MSETHDLQGVPQFETAEFHEQPAPDACCICHQPISGAYYRINGSRACASCSEQVKGRNPKDTHAAYSRAILFGLGGALLGLILYSAVGILLHVEIGYVSLAVGYLVGKAMMKGSGSIGGRRYQWMAVLLTYAAVSVSAIPIAIAQYAHSKPHTAQVQRQGAQSDAQQSQQGDGSTTAKKLTPGRAGMLIGILLLYGLASPFLGLISSPFSGIIGMFILFIGIRIAWQITAGPAMPAIEGPY